MEGDISILVSWDQSKSTVLYDRISEKTKISEIYIEEKFEVDVVSYW